MKKFLLFISFCLLCLTQIRAKEVVEDFSTNIWNLATSNQKKSGKGTYTSTTTGYTYNITWGNSCYWFSTQKALFIGKTSGNFIELPAFPGTVTKIVINNSAQCSISAAIKITDNAGNVIAASQTFSTQKSAYTYEIPADKQAAGKVLRLVLNSGKNVQITKITITVDEGEPTQVAKPTTTAADKMLYGAEYTISSAEGTTLYYCVDGTDTYSQAASNTVPLNAPTEGESFTIKAYATKDGLTDSDMLEKTVTLYPPTPATALIDEVILTDTKVTGTTYKPFSNVIKYGAEYAGKCYPGQDGTAIQFNNSTTNGKGSAIFMTQSVGNVNKVVVDWNSKTTSGRKLQVYGQNTPYEAYTSDETKYIGANAVKGDLLGTIEYGTSTELYITGEYQYILVMEAGEGVLYLNSIKFIWNNPFTGSETTYNKENGTSNIKENKFVTLVDTQNNIAFSRKDADTGTIVGAAAKVNNDESNGGKFVTLDQNQIFIDEFQLVPAVGGFKLYGGTPFIRRYIGVDATGLTTTTDETAAAVVKFVQYGDGIVAQFTDGDYIVSDGTNFGKGTPTGTEAPASLAEGATLVPAYVFVSKGNNSTGVEDIEMVETEAPAQYYNLNGVEVKAGNLVPGIYIVRQGNKVSKQFIR